MRRLAKWAGLTIGLVLLLFVALVAYWTKVRDRLRHKIRQFMEEGRAQTAAQRSQRSRA